MEEHMASTMKPAVLRSEEFIVYLTGILHTIWYNSKIKKLAVCVCVWAGGGRLG